MNSRYDICKKILTEENYKVFKIIADYKKQEPHPSYLMIGLNKNKIKNIFCNRYTWLDIIKIEEFKYNKDDEKNIDYLIKNIIWR